MTAAITLTPGRTTLVQWRAVADGAPVRLDPAAAPVIEAGARAVDAIIARGEPVYGVNTGFGKLASVHIASADLAALQRNIVLSHAAGVGEPMRPANVRLMMALKLASLGRGASGVRVRTVEMLDAMLARDLIPVIPSQGSVGASGDLAPLAHLAAAMLGIGEAQHAGERMPAAAALARAGLAPIALGPKEGLALLNGTQLMTAIGALLIEDADRLARTASLIAAMSVEAMLGTDVAFAAAYHAARPHP
ncbi:MAG: aromatic amino acid lyase, partial [Xanthobacteraceae bacterium]